jgi:hypothetical protein
MGAHSDRIAGRQPSQFLRKLTLVLMCFQFSAFVLVRGLGVTSDNMH